MSSRTSQEDGNRDTCETMLIIDIIRYFNGLADLNDDSRTGNQELGRGLRQLAKGLGRYSSCTISEFVDQIKEKSVRSKGASRRQRVSLPPSLESVSQQEVERILGNDDYTKKQIVEVGIRRFGISRSKLERSNKQDALNSVYAALDHEKSLDVISKEASRGVRVS